MPMDIIVQRLFKVDSTMTKIEILIDYTKCETCSELTCIDICPHGVFEIDEKGNPSITDIVSCTVCRICENLCPEKAIQVKQ